MPITLVFLPSLVTGCGKLELVLVGLVGGNFSAHTGEIFCNAMHAYFKSKMLWKTMENIGKKWKPMDWL